MHVFEARLMCSLANTVDDKLKAHGRQGFEGTLVFATKCGQNPSVKCFSSPQEQAPPLGTSEGKLCVISQDASSLVLQGR